MQPLYFLITTAGADTNSICYETHQKAKDILEGRKIDPTFYPVIYGADESDDWTDPKVWKKANPSLGITVGIDKVRAALRRAPNRIPARRIPSGSCGSTSGVKQAVRWMPMEKWDACAFPVNEDDLEGRVLLRRPRPILHDGYHGICTGVPADGMRRINTSCSHTSGYRKRPLTYASDATTFLMTSGNGRDISRLRRATLSTTVIFEKFIERLGRTVQYPGDCL